MSIYQACAVPVTLQTIRQKEVPDEMSIAAYRRRPIMLIWYVAPSVLGGQTGLPFLQ